MSQGPVLHNTNEKAGQHLYFKTERAAEKYSGYADEVWYLLRPIAFLAFTRPILKTIEHLQSGAYIERRVMLPLYDKGVYKIVDIRNFLKALAEREEVIKAKVAKGNEVSLQNV